MTAYEHTNESPLHVSLRWLFQSARKRQQQPSTTINNHQQQQPSTISSTYNKNSSQKRTLNVDNKHKQITFNHPTFNPSMNQLKPNNQSINQSIKITSSTRQHTHTRHNLLLICLSFITSTFNFTSNHNFHLKHMVHLTPTSPPALQIRPLLPLVRHRHLGSWPPVKVGRRSWCLENTTLQKRFF